MTKKVELLTWHLVVVGVFAAIFLVGVLAFPVSIALKGRDATTFEVVAAGSYYLLGWTFTGILALDGLSYLYNFQRPFVSSRPGTWITFRDSSVRTRGGPLGTAIVSFAITLYGYVVLYLYLSHLNPTAFHPRSLTIIDAVYFTLVTAATVGFGDTFTRAPMQRRF